MLFLLLLTALFFLFIRTLYPFLAPNKKPDSGIMVVEGWIHDFALDEAVCRYRTGNYSHIICTGIPIEIGSYIQPFKSYPEMTAARLRALGIPEDEIIVAIADETDKDRTYQSAVALREILMASNLPGHDLHLVSVGPHGRRSRMLFKKALGRDYRIGVTSIADQNYSPDNWYRCSEGVRAVIGEFIAYAYAKFLFHP